MDQDQYSLAPEIILTSVVKRVDLVMFEIIKELSVGKFQGGKCLIFSLKGDFVNLVESSANHISSELLAKVALVKDKIEKGEIMVPRNAVEFKGFFINSF